MGKYICKRCGYTVNHKYNFVKHLQRKNVCKPILENIDINTIKHQFNVEVGNNFFEVTPFDSQLTPIDSQLTPFDSLNNASSCMKNKLFQCNYCQKELSKNSNLHRHLKICKAKKQVVDNNQTLNDLQKQIDSLSLKVDKKKAAKTNITNNNNCNNVNNTNINIQLNGFGEENLDYITPEYIYALAQGPSLAIPKLLKKIHFNPEHPENMNVKLTNKKLPLMNVYNDAQKKWIFKDKKDTITTMVEQGYSIIDDNLSEKKHNSEMKNFLKFSERYEKDDKIVLKRLNKNVELLLINKS